MVNIFQSFSVDGESRELFGSEFLQIRIQTFHINVTVVVVCVCDLFLSLEG